MTASTPTFEDFQKFSKQQLEAFTAASSTVERSAGYRGRVRATIRRRLSPPDRRWSRSFSARESSRRRSRSRPNYAKQAYEGFVAQATKISELYIQLASDALKPVTTAYASVRSN